MRIKIPFTIYEGLKYAILKQFKIKDINDQSMTVFDYINKQKKGTKHIYDILIKSLYMKPKTEIKWEHELNLPGDFDLFQKL